MGADPGNQIDEDGGCIGCEVIKEAGQTIIKSTIETSATVVAKQLTWFEKAVRKTTQALKGAGEVLSHAAWNAAGASAAILDNFTGGFVNLRNNFAPNANTNPAGAQYYNAGLIGGDAGSMVMAAMEGGTGEGMIGAGGVLTIASGGTASEVSVPMVGLGAGMVVHSGVFYGRAMYNFMHGSGKVNINSQNGGKEQNAQTELPKYENPGTHDPKSPNFNREKAVLPKNHQELFEKSALMPDGNRWTKTGSGNKAVYDRFQDDGNGTWHWNGSSNGKKVDGTPYVIEEQNIPVQIKRQK
jgi:hypothetical protein